MRSDTVAVRDRILAALREGDDYMTTEDVGTRAGTTYTTQVCRGAAGHHQPNYFGHCANGMDIITVDLCRGSNRCLRELHALAAQGLVEKATQINPRRLFWRYSSTEADVAPMLEAIWEAPARDSA